MIQSAVFEKIFTAVDPFFQMSIIPIYKQNLF